MSSKTIFKASITTTLLCLLFFISSAQVYSNKESSTFSFTAGITSSNLVNDTVKHKPSVSFNGGFIETLVLSDKINIGLELLYTGKALKDESKIVKYRYFYLDVPLYLQYKASENIRFNLGAQYSSFTNSKIIFLNGNSSGGVDIEPYNNIKPADYGFLIGAEIDLTKNIAFALRYTISTSTFFEKESINFGVFQASFNYAVYRSHKQLLNRQKEKE